MPNLKQLLKPTKPTNNNQTQPTNQIKPSRFHLKTWQWVSVLIVVAVIVAGVFVMWNQKSPRPIPRDREISEHEKRIYVEAKIREAIRQASYCSATKDCILLGEYCPFSNSWETYINKQEKENIQNIIEDFNKNTSTIIECKPSVCNNVSPVQCVEGKCYVECQDEISNQNKSVSITTDKTEYAAGETIEITLINSLDIPITIKDEKFISEGVTDLEKKTEAGWQKINLIAIPKAMIIRKLLHGESYTYKWDQTISFETKASEGAYRFKFSIGTEERILISYSNEFAIRIQVGQKVNGLDLAQEVLIKYFSLLNEGKYSEAVKYHGSGYDYIQPSCPKIDLSNYAGLLECGCHFLVCENINIVKKEQVSINEFVLTVQFVN